MRIKNSHKMLLGVLVILIAFSAGCRSLFVQADVAVDDEPIEKVTQ